MKTIILIDELNDGFILTINGKTKAVENIFGVYNIIGNITKDAISGIGAPNVTRSIVTIEFEENPPIKS